MAAALHSIKRSSGTSSFAKNRAFVFVKPHAVTSQVKDLVRDQLKRKEIDVLQEGLIDSGAIDRGMLIDKHYYAIASKATLLKPDKLPVPAAKFQSKFGLDWFEVLSSGAALNARDACEKFGVDAAGLAQLWVKAKDEGQLVKFSGGFYCAKIDAPVLGGAFYVFNGFFMEMRNKYVKPGAAIYYYIVEWSPLDLSWADFRGHVLGPTDPSAAPSDSIRGIIYEKWQEFGLAEKPNIADNGVHASASPIEALFERMNWLDIKVEDDPFGMTLLDNDVTKELIEEWRRDPQVTFGRRGSKLTKCSLYDALEDIDSDRCKIKCQDIARTGRTHATVIKNRAFVLVKPHATTNKCTDCVRQMFQDRGLRIMQEGIIEADQIDQDSLVDKHYYSIASKATLLPPEKLNVPAGRFKAKFCMDWTQALSQGLALNAQDACRQLHLTSAELATLWSRAKEEGSWVKFNGGFYCAKIPHQDKHYYVFNGFYMEMRDKFVKQGAEVHYFVVEWDPVHLSWADFRGDLLGPTDPSTAQETSIRGRIYREWERLELRSRPDITDNAVHASASPIEALFERMNWLDTRLERDPFGKILLQHGVSSEQIVEWSKDPQVLYGLGPTRGSFYDCLEDKDSDACCEECSVIARAGHTGAVVRNTALVFIKPHAITEKVTDFVRSHLVSKELQVISEGLIDAETIDRNMLIDKHYYAIASKATLLEPSKLPVPEDKFKAKFCVEWKEVLEKGQAINAKQACEKMKLDAAGLGAKWVEAKAAGNLVKLGGGFYCARIDVKLESEGDCTFYVFNGFFMEMRDKYVAPGAAIHYFVAEWDPLDLSWSDFRANVLGSTDPSTAPEDSLRGMLLARWQELGLNSEPNIADNGVHASASPFEALCERMNWLELGVYDDTFGQLLLHGGVSTSHIEEWALDPQITFLSHQQKITCSLYDALEDLDADRCLTQCQLIVGDAVVEDEKMLTSNEAEALHKRGKVLGTTSEDKHEAYSFKYIVEDPAALGPVWEVTCEQKKLRECEYEEPVWSGRKVTKVEAEKLLALLSAPQPRRSPLNNRLPTSPGGRASLNGRFPSRQSHSSFGA